MPTKEQPLIGPAGKVLEFRTSSQSPARAITRDGFGRPITHVFGLRISDRVNLFQPYQIRRIGGVVEVFQSRATA